MKINTKLILASGSPRRQQILKEAGIIFFIKTKPTPEDYPANLTPEEIPEFLARKKAFPFLGEISEEIVISADTVVILDGEVIGKPADFDDAFQMLKKLSGKKHRVTTGVCIASKEKQISFSDHTDVYFKVLSDDDINYYLNNYKPYDKAGAYGIQEWIGYIGIEKINGSFYNVMGLPVHLVIDHLKEFN